MGQFVFPVSCLELWHYLQGGSRLDGEGWTVKYPKLRRHFETRKQSRPLHTVYIEMYSGNLLTEGFRWRTVPSRCLVTLHEIQTFVRRFSRVGNTQEATVVRSEGLHTPQRACMHLIWQLTFNKVL